MKASQKYRNELKTLNEAMWEDFIRTGAEIYAMKRTATDLNEASGVYMFLLGKRFALQKYLRKRGGK